MRNPQRIDEVLDALRDYWKRNPDLRLGQIVSNATPSRFSNGRVRDPFHVEDDEMLRGIRNQPDLWDSAGNLGPVEKGTS